MFALIDQYLKELEKVNLFAASTIETYTIGVKAFCEYTKDVLGIDPAMAKADHLLQWLLHLKHTSVGYSRLQRIVKDQAKMAGISTPVTPRVLRHSFATEMYHKKYPLPPFVP